tara:strand:- start:8115 stop:8285 length:171 start_codon:yes stop_codon:yes gene_type:complete
MAVTSWRRFGGTVWRAARAVSRIVLVVVVVTVAVLAVAVLANGARAVFGTVAKPML